MAYEDWSVDGDLVGLPTLVGNPSVAFAGVVRGLRYRCRDLGRPEDDGARAGAAAGSATSAARARGAPIARGSTGSSPAGCRRRSATIRASAGGAWSTLQTKLGVLELRARQDPASSDAASARALRGLLDRLSREIGRAPDDDAGAGAHQRSRARRACCACSTRRSVAGRRARRRRRRPARALALPEPRPPGGAGPGRARRCAGSRAASPSAASSRTPTRGRSPASVPRRRTAGAPRPVANPEMFGDLPLAPSLHEAAVRTFPTFEAYMDAALHDPRWGYYAAPRVDRPRRPLHHQPGVAVPALRRVDRGAGFSLLAGHGRARRAAETDPFPIVEFGAGNGRLARDVLDAVAGHAARTTTRRRTFAARVAYRIYETSASLRDRQRALLGRRRASSREGDARRPGGDAGARFPRRRQGPRADERGPRRVRRPQGAC